MSKEKVVICGAGPIGLYLAIRLNKMGVKNILVAEPRKYTRPGHLGTAVLKIVQNSLDVDFEDLLAPGKNVHIKELEKKLYKKACELGITIEQKRFVDFTNKAGKKGVILADDEGNPSEVESYLIFDCTGQRREVIRALNAIKPSTFSINRITSESNILVKNYYIAYAKMSAQHRNALASNNNSTPSDEHFVTYMEKFHQMGWKEFYPPKLTAAYFGKDKICIYIEQPNNLAVEFHEQWLQTVLEYCSCNPSITYQHCSPPKKVQKKPRFCSFTVDPHELSPLSFQGSQELPMVIAQGDSQIDFLHSLGNGIINGIARVDKMFGNMEIIDGIIYFDGDNYAHNVEPILNFGRQVLIQHYAKEYKKGQDSLQNALDLYLQVLSQTSDSQELTQLQSTISIISARITYTELLRNLEICEDPKKKGDLVSTLQRIGQDLAFARTFLPQEYILERASLPGFAQTAALHYKNIATQWFMKQRYEEAIITTKQMLKLYEPLYQDTPCYLERILTISNLILCYKNLGKMRDCIEIIQNVMKEFPTSDKDINTHIQRVICNFFIILSSAIERGEEFGEELKPLIEDCYNRLSPMQKSIFKSNLAILSLHFNISMDIEDVDNVSTYSSGFFLKDTMEGNAPDSIAEVTLS